MATFSATLRRETDEKAMAAMMTPEEQFVRNLDRAFELFEKILEQPARLDVIADGVDLVAMPADDPELRAANKPLAQALGLYV